MREPRLPEVYLIVDDTGEDEATLRVDFLIRPQVDLPASDPFYVAVLYKHIGRKAAAAVNYGAALD